MVTFKDKIKDILKDNGFDYKKVTIYAGRNIEKTAQRRSMKLVAWKENGVWQGDLDVVKEQGEKGDSIYLRDYHDKTEPLKYVMFSDCDWDDDEEYARNKMLKILQNWKFVEKERAKLEK